jgi:hypothetical protein
MLGVRGKTVNRMNRQRFESGTILRPRSEPGREEKSGGIAEDAAVC